MYYPQVIFAYFYIYMYIYYILDIYIYYILDHIYRCILLRAIPHVGAPSHAFTPKLSLQEPPQGTPTATGVRDQWKKDVLEIWQQFGTASIQYPGVHRVGP